MYLRLKVEQIQTDSDLFLLSNAAGKLAITSAMIYEDSGAAVRGAEVNQRLIKLLNETKIQIP